MIKKSATSALFILSFVFYAAYQQTRGSVSAQPLAVAPLPTQVETVPAQNNASPSALPSTATPTPTHTPTQTPTPIPTATKPKGQYTDGTYTGSLADAYYGSIQVEAIIQNGKLADVRFLSYPNDRRTSIEINTQAMPLLKQEAIKAQSAQVNGVSGATDTSIAFRESLASALNQAHV